MVVVTIKQKGKNENLNATLVNHFLKKQVKQVKRLVMLVREDYQVLLQMACQWLLKKRQNHLKMSVGLLKQPEKVLKMAQMIVLYQLSRKTVSLCQFQIMRRKLADTILLLQQDYRIVKMVRKCRIRIGSFQVLNV